MYHKFVLALYPASGEVGFPRFIAFDKQAVIVEKGPPIDGTLDSPIWGKCPPLVLGECTSDKPGAMKTTARVLFDATKLYAAWVCHETDMGSIRQNVTERDGQVWQDD